MKTGMTGKTGVTLTWEPWQGFQTLPRWSAASIARRLPTRLLLLTATLAGVACEKKAEGPKPCCTQIDIPPGVPKFTIVAEDVTGPSDGQKVMIKAGMLQPIKRDQMYAPMKVLYANVMKRTAFEPIHFEGWFYASESDARAGNESNAIAKIVRGQSDGAPKCENNVKYDFPEQVERAFIHSTQGEQVLQEDLNDTCHIGEKKKVVRYDEKFAHKTTYKLDAGNQAVEISYPFLEMGKDEFVADLKTNSAMGVWAEYMTSMFSHAEQLKSLTFIGIYKEEPVMKISISRQQFDNLLARLQETIAAHAAITFQTIGMGAKTSEQAEKEQESFKSKTYQDALGKLPKEQVTISSSLKWVKGGQGAILKKPGGRKAR
jgi:hypothetical protein